MSLDLMNIYEKSHQRYQQKNNILSFKEYFSLLNKNPYPLIRPASRYCLDAIYKSGLRSKNLFGQEVNSMDILCKNVGDNHITLKGQEHTQHKLLQIITSLNRSDKLNKLILLHGPNGSAKSTIVNNLFHGLEHYSQQEEGQLYTFSWIFPEKMTQKRELGIHAQSDEVRDVESYANLKQENIAAIVRSELHENPIFLIPKEERTVLLEEWIQQVPEEDKDRVLSLKNYIEDSSLSQKNSLIFDALLNEYQGDLSKVYKHIRVERFYLNKHYRKGLVSIRPQFSIDANMRQVTLDRSLAQLPPALQSLNLFQLEGDLVDSNRGCLEYDDLLKRPFEHFKYLLAAIEENSINLGHVVVNLDTLLIATTNDRQLESFREHPEFNSFKSRVEFIKVPYLLRYDDEEQIYTETIQNAAGTKEVLPHTSKVIALWAVLSRLKRPLLKEKDPKLTLILEKLTPLEKAKLYNHEELPSWLDANQRKTLRPHVAELFEEHQSFPYYEGLLGASARELKIVIQLAAQNPEYSTLSPSAIFNELGKLVKQVNNYEYLRQEALNGYHSFAQFIEVVKDEWLSWVDKEFWASTELENTENIEDYLVKYLNLALKSARGEKIKNQISGEMTTPDESMMQSFEKQVGISSNHKQFRNQLVEKLGAWAVSNQHDNTQALPFLEIYPDLVSKIQASNRQEHFDKITQMAELLDSKDIFTKIQNEDAATLNDASKQLLTIYKNMQSKHGYGEIGAKEAITELLKTRYAKS